jgi:hypothetical protein
MGTHEINPKIVALQTHVSGGSSLIKIEEIKKGFHLLFTNFLDMLHVNYKTSKVDAIGEESNKFGINQRGI